MTSKFLVIVIFLSLNLIKCDSHEKRIKSLLLNNSNTNIKQISFNNNTNNPNNVNNKNIITSKEVLKKTPVIHVNYSRTLNKTDANKKSHQNKNDGNFEINYVEEYGGHNENEFSRSYHNKGSKGYDDNEMFDKEDGRDYFMRNGDDISDIKFDKNLAHSDIGKIYKVNSQVIDALTNKKANKESYPISPILQQLNSTTPKQGIVVENGNMKEANFGNHKGILKRFDIGIQKSDNYQNVKLENITKFRDIVTDCPIKFKKRPKQENMGHKSLIKDTTNAETNIKPLQADISGGYEAFIIHKSPSKAKRNGNTNYNEKEFRATGNERDSVINYYPVIKKVKNFRHKSKKSNKNKHKNSKIENYNYNTDGSFDGNDNGGRKNYDKGNKYDYDTEYEIMNDRKNDKNYDDYDDVDISNIESKATDDENEQKYMEKAIARRNKKSSVNSNNLIGKINRQNSGGHKHKSKMKDLGKVKIYKNDERRIKKARKNRNFPNDVLNENDGMQNVKIRKTKENYQQSNKNYGPKQVNSQRILQSKRRSQNAISSKEQSRRRRPNNMYRKEKFPETYEEISKNSEEEKEEINQNIKQPKINLSKRKSKNFYPNMKIKQEFKHKKPTQNESKNQNYESQISQETFKDTKDYGQLKKKKFKNPPEHVNNLKRTSLKPRITEYDYNGPEIDEDEAQMQDPNYEYYEDLESKNPKFANKDENDKSEEIDEDSEQVYLNQNESNDDYNNVVDDLDNIAKIKGHKDYDSEEDFDENVDDYYEDNQNLNKDPLKHKQNVRIPKNFQSGDYEEVEKNENYSDLKRQTKQCENCNFDNDEDYIEEQNSDY